MKTHLTYFLTYLKLLQYQYNIIDYTIIDGLIIKTIKKLAHTYLATSREIN